VAARYHHGARRQPPPYLCGCAALQCASLFTGPIAARSDHAAPHGMAAMGLPVAHPPQPAMNLPVAAGSQPLDLGGQQVDHEPAVCPGCQEGQ